MGGVGKQGNRCDRCDKIIIGKERKEVSYHIILSKKNPYPHWLGVQHGVRVKI